MNKTLAASGTAAALTLSLLASCAHKTAIESPDGKDRITVTSSKPLDPEELCINETGPVMEGHNQRLQEIAAKVIAGHELSQEDRKAVCAAGRDLSDAFRTCVQDLGIQSVIFEHKDDTITSKTRINVNELLQRIDDNAEAFCKLPTPAHQ